MKLMNKIMLSLLAVSSVASTTITLPFRPSQLLKIAVGGGLLSGGLYLKSWKDKKTLKESSEVKPMPKQPKKASTDIKKSDDKPVIRAKGF